MSVQRSKEIPVVDLVSEEASVDLVNSASMKPYLDLLIARMKGEDIREPLAALSALPLEQRYVWRVVSALKWGLCDLETENIGADMATLSPDDLRTVAEPLEIRALQFSLFLRTLLGEKAAREIMLKALNLIEPS